VRLRVAARSEQRQYPTWRIPAVAVCHNGCVRRQRCQLKSLLSAVPALVWAKLVNARFTVPAPLPEFEFVAGDLHELGDGAEDKCNYVAVMSGFRTALQHVS
jgi:hypothetical protein